MSKLLSPFMLVRKLNLLGVRNSHVIFLQKYFKSSLKAISPSVNPSQSSNLSIHILYEDNHLLVINKPPGLLAQGDVTQDESCFDLCKKYHRYLRPQQERRRQDSQPELSILSCQPPSVFRRRMPREHPAFRGRMPCEPSVCRSDEMTSF